MANQDYIAKNKAWLAAKAAEPGVKILDRGILYKIIKSGKPGGVHPGRNSVVTAHYVGKTINGRMFDSSRGGVAPAFRLRELIPGWIIALQQMVPGDNGSCTYRRSRGMADSVSPVFPAALCSF